MRDGLIKQLKISGYRRLRKVHLPMKPFMVLIGANGVGKTSLLDALSLLSASAAGDLNQTLSRGGGLNNLLTRGKSEGLQLVAELRVSDSERFLYVLNTEATGMGYTIAAECLWEYADSGEIVFRIESRRGEVSYFDKPGADPRRPDWEYNPLESALSQVPRTYAEPEKVRRGLANIRLYRGLDTGPRAPVRLPQAMKPAQLPGADGEDLVPYLYYLRENDPRRFDVIIDTLRAAFPDFRTLSFPPVAAGMLTMAWTDAKFSKPMYIHELSEGTLRFIWLVSLLHSPDLSAVTMIDEPEVSLHPELLGVLAEVMRGAAKRTQLIVATHSDRLVRFLRPEEVAVMDLDEAGCAGAVWADEMDLEKWLADYGLDEVWRMGRMGGRA